MMASGESKLLRGFFGDLDRLGGRIGLGNAEIADDEDGRGAV